MALSADTKHRLEVALALPSAGDEIQAAIDANTGLAHGLILVGDTNGNQAEVAMSGDATIADTGAVTIAAKAVTAAKIALTDGHIFVGGAGGAATDLAMSGDVAIADTGATTVQTTKLAKSENSYIKTDAGVKDLLVAAAAARVVMIVVTVTTAFADGDGAQPTLSIGEESGSASKFAATSKFASAAAGDTFTFSGTLTSGKKLQATLVAGTGTTETGAYTIDVIAVG